MSRELRDRLFGELDSLELIDPHTHINPYSPAASTLADILGYHYYTELAHSAGLPQERIEEPGIDPREKVRRLVDFMNALDNTIQYSWLIEMLQVFFDFDGDRLTQDNWEQAYDAAEIRMSSPDWANQVLTRSRLKAVFLTNNFDDSLTGFDSEAYVPCLRTDELVFHLTKGGVRERLQTAANVSVSDAHSLREGIAKLFEHFTAHGARACAISLPPDFSPIATTVSTAAGAVQAVLEQGESAGRDDQRVVSQFVFWTLAEFCGDFGLPFDLMIGVNRGVYESGVFQGQDLYDSRVSLIQYRHLFNAFPQVTFPISVLASVTNQELVSYAWIFPNVVTNGHWWYSNTPSKIELDAAHRLEAVPRAKQIAYYSDMYKLEFALPKFAMYKRILAKILAEQFVIDRGWSETRAMELGRQVLRENTERIFPMPNRKPG